MADKRRIAAAMKAVPGARPTMAPQPSGYGSAMPMAAMMGQSTQYQNSYGPFLPRPPKDFTDGAFGPMSPIQPVPVDNPPEGGQFADPRWWQYTTGWNLPTPPGTEGLKLAPFEKLKTIAERYSVARAAISLRQNEIRGLGWDIALTKEAAKAYQGSHSAMKDAGERIGQITQFFRQPDPDYWNFEAFLNALLEEIFVYDAVSVIFRPKFGEKLGMGGKGLLGSRLDSLRLVSGPTIRPLVDLHGGRPAPPAPAYQQFLYGVPRSDYVTLMRGEDIADTGLTEAFLGEYASDVMLYAPYWARRETPYGFPPVEQSLLPIISGLQKQEYQLDYYTEGSVPAVYISPGDPNITPTQIRELQDALNGIAGDPAYHMKVVVLPPGSKVEPQRQVDLSDSFDTLVQTQVLMAFDIQPSELGILPNISGGGSQGPSSGAVRLGMQESRDVKSRKSTKPLLRWISSIFNVVIQDICGQKDLRFQFEGLAEDDDLQVITQLGVQQVQNGIASIDEVRDRLDLAPWGLKETSEPVVFTAQGPIPFSMAPQLIAAMTQQAGGGGQSNGDGKPANQGNGNNGTQSTNGGQRSPSTRSRTSQPSVRRGGQTRPNGSHPAPLSPPRESLTPAHSAAGGALQSPTPRTGGTTSRSSVAGSRKKAIASELDALRRHLRKNRDAIWTWQPRHIETIALARIADDLATGTLVDVAVKKELGRYPDDLFFELPAPPPSEVIPDPPAVKAVQFPGWEHDLGLVGRGSQMVAKAFGNAETKGAELRKRAAAGEMFISSSTLSSLIVDEVAGELAKTLTPLWEEAWNLGYEGGRALATGDEADFSRRHATSAMKDFVATQGAHWIEEISRTGLVHPGSRSELISRTEVARAMNAGAIAAYRDNGVTHKQLLLSPEGACELCKSAHDLGSIPLDSPFPGGGLGGPLHPADRCIPGPASADVEPPLAHLGKSAKGNLAWLLPRARNAEGKYVFLLQQRNDGTWGMAGGGLHSGEDPWEGAIREATEELGDLPTASMEIAAEFHHAEDNGQLAYVYLVDVPYFRPALNGSTPEETRGAAWFRRREVDDLNLTPKFSEDWEKTPGIRDFATKYVQREVNPSGEQSYAGGGALNWPYAARSSHGFREEEPHYNQAPGEMGATEPPRQSLDSDTPTRIYPRGDDDEDFPKDRSGPNPRRKKNPKGGVARTNGAVPSPGASEVGGNTGVPPSGDSPTKMYLDAILGKTDVYVPGEGTLRPVVGSVEATTPHPYEPHTDSLKPYDPALSVPILTPQGNAFPSQAKSVANPSDPNPVDAEHVYSLMSKNFPAAALGWVRNATWIGPVNVPWDRIDSDDQDRWAASHQPDKVEDFVSQIREHSGHVRPAILIHHPDHPRAVIVDGHHRALAHKKLGMPVRAYIGTPRPGDLQQAFETHSSQIHQGDSEENR